MPGPVQLVVTFLDASGGQLGRMEQDFLTDPLLDDVVEVLVPIQDFDFGSSGPSERFPGCSESEARRRRGVCAIESDETGAVGSEEGGDRPVLIGESRFRYGFASTDALIATVSITGSVVNLGAVGTFELSTDAGGTFDLSSVLAPVTAVPEPGALELWAIALGSLVALRRAGENASRLSEIDRAVSPSLFSEVLMRYLSRVAVSVGLLMPSAAVSLATPPEPKLRITGAEVQCDVTPPQVTLHGDFGATVHTITLVLDFAGVPNGLWIVGASPDSITAELPGCDPAGTYRLTVGYGADSNPLSNLLAKLRPPQFYTTLDLTLGSAGPAGPSGPPGNPGPPGADGTPGTDGSPGVDGLDGLSCWDLNENRSCDVLDPSDPLHEDIDGDGVCTPADCKGPQGERGFTGPQGAPGSNGANGAPGISCWDSNANLTCDLATEDMNGDAACSPADCTGPQGPQGIAGAPGEIDVLAGLVCPEGQSVIGFNVDANIICGGNVLLCPNDQTVCNGSCTDLLADPNNCGACGNVCSSCSLGTCFSGERNLGFYDVDPVPGGGFRCDSPLGQRSFQLRLDGEDLTGDEDVQLVQTDGSTVRIFVLQPYLLSLGSSSVPMEVVPMEPFQLVGVIEGGHFSTPTTEISISGTSATFGAVDFTAPIAFEGVISVTGAGEPIAFAGSQASGGGQLNYIDQGFLGDCQVGTRPFEGSRVDTP